jgi:hypothetical protein
VDKGQQALGKARRNRQVRKLPQVPHAVKQPYGSIGTHGIHFLSAGKHELKRTLDKTIPNSRAFQNVNTGRKLGQQIRHKNASVLFEDDSLPKGELRQRWILPL